MKILYFHQYFSTRQGATGTRPYEQARALCEAGHEVRVVCGSFDVANTGLSGEFVDGVRHGNVDGIDVTEYKLNFSNSHGLLKRSLAFLRFALRSAALAFRSDADLIFASSTPLTAAIPGIVAKLRRGRIFIFEVRDVWPELPKAMGAIKNPVVLWALGVLERRAYRSADGFVGLSPGIVARFREVVGDATPMTLVSNGSDVEMYKSLAAEGERMRPAHAEESDFVAVFTGTHGKANGLDAVLHAAEVLKVRGRDDIKLAFIGSGSEKPHLKELAQEKQLDNCLFIDAVPKTTLAGYFQGADAGLMILDNVPAFYQGTSPNKFFDYLANGLALVTNYPGWVADIIEKEEIGLAVPPEQPELLADALVQLADDREQTRLFGERALEIGRRDFNRENLSARFVEFLETTVAEHGTRGRRP